MRAELIKHLREELSFADAGVEEASDFEIAEAAWILLQEFAAEYEDLKDGYSVPVSSKSKN